MDPEEMVWWRAKFTLEAKERAARDGICDHPDPLVAEHLRKLFMDAKSKG